MPGSASDPMDVWVSRGSAPLVDVVVAVVVVDEMVTSAAGLGAAL